MPDWFPPEVAPRLFDTDVRAWVTKRLGVGNPKPTYKILRMVWAPTLRTNSPFCYSAVLDLEFQVHEGITQRTQIAVSIGMRSSTKHPVKSSLCLEI